jgi:murein DD-endopeptidase MepM/ murein hydrolase activator NlpD
MSAPDDYRQPAYPPHQETGARDRPSYQPPYQPAPGRDQVSALPSTPPAWEAHPVIAGARRIAASTYVVRPSDTLRGIATKTGAGSLAIAKANGLVEPFHVSAGERLTIPGGRYHLIQRGDTGIAIAQAYGVPWSQIIDANGLGEPYLLRAGWRLLIPDGGAPALAAASPRHSTAAERAAAFHLDIDDLVTGSEPAIADNGRPARPTRSPSRVLASITPVATPQRLTGGFSWPVHGRIISSFGPTTTGERNDGIQIAVPKGTPVLAAADGVVAYVGSSIPSLGGLIIVKHGDGYTTVYGNAKKLLVQRGQSVRRGEEIAVSGETGAATQPSLHFEIRKGRDPIDPLGKLSRES